MSAMSKIRKTWRGCTGRRSRAALGAVCVVAVVAGGVTAGSAVAEPDRAATGTVRSPNGRWPVNLRSGPSLKSAKVGRVRDGGRVTIVCTARGDRVEGRWGATDVWDKLDSGRWISDAFVDTGTNDPAAPDCSGGDPEPSKPEEPTGPDEPSKPDKPTKPDEPTKPDKPTIPEDPAKPTPGAGEGESAWEKQVLDLVNAERRKKGCQPMRMDDRLTRAARLHNQEMRDRRYFNHISPDRSHPYPEHRAKAQGYQGEVSENIGMGQTSPKEIMDGWMFSSGHRENMLNCSWKSAGVGALKGNSRRGSLLDTGPWWTMMFGAR
ncbi:CAP domain-containing protein [Nocardia sp. CDC159]|uniref:CAP domain-containing protein n=1 Tax=Nocardia pulmonis TaxID=2951408 RepID=A0A9X2E4X5_9NOCA|nr:MULTISPECIES: CAP domain-containing protein [Nocardia]MCM6774299.1 CAP domain-containing protein [Nocardia pulmonis]MCM6787635.1 CAP domain-containing protein [Nocardia sp. CDC159]